MADPKLQIILAAKDITGRALTKFQGRIKAITKSVFSFKGALGSLAGASGIGILVTRSLEAADAIGKTADKLGITTDALQEFRYAAERSGVQTKTLDMALQRFTRRVAEAAQGKGELRAILEQYNIAVRDAAGSTRRTVDVFRDLADVIQRTKDPAERLRIAFKGFDSEGAALVNMLRDGSIGLDQFADKAHELGVILDNDLIRGAEQAKDAMDDMGKVIQTNFSRIVLENVESITAAVEQLAGAMGKIAKYAGLRSISGTVAQGARLSTQGMLDWDKFIKSSFIERQRMVDQALGGAEVGPDGRTIIRKKITGQPSAGSAAPGSVAPPLPLVKTTRPGGIFGVPIGADYPADFAGDWQRSFDSIDGIMQDFKQKQAEQSQELLDSWSAGYGDQFVDMFDESFREVNEIVAQSSSKMIELTERTAWAMQANFSGFFFDAMQGEFKSLADYVDGFLESISRAFSDFASQQLIEGLFGNLTKAGGGGGWLGMLFGSTSAQGNVFGPQGLKPFGRGGVVPGPAVFPFAGGIGLMGERGPEAIMPLKRTPSGDLGVQASGGGVDVVINNYSGLPATQRQININGRRTLMVDIGNDILSGGPTAQAIGSRFAWSPVGKLT